MTTIITYPWATWDMDEMEKTGKPTHICPICEERIVEPNGKGRNYQKHYDQKHRDNA